MGHTAYIVSHNRNGPCMVLHILLIPFLTPVVQAKYRPTRAECLFIADLAGEAERYEGWYIDPDIFVINLIHSFLDVVVQIKMIIDQFGAQLTIDERNLLSVAYKNITNILRSSWRIVDNMEKMHTSRSSGVTRQIVLMRRQRDRIERELTDACRDIVLLLDRQLLPSARPGEEAVFYSKMQVFRFSRISALGLIGSELGKEIITDTSLNLRKSGTESDMETSPLMPTSLRTNTRCLRSTPCIPRGWV